MNNVVEHAGAGKAHVKLTSTPDYVALVVEDDGCGFDTTNTFQGRHGLAGMSERARFLRGSMVIDSAPGRGTRLEIRIPAQERT